MINVKVLRFNPETDDKSYIESYNIEINENTKILDVLNLINEKYDAEIAFRSSCRAGQCGSCAIKVNGEVALACKAVIKEDTLLEPIDLPVIKDLIVNRSGIDEKVSKMKLFLEKNEIENDKPEIISPEKCINTKKIRNCIECYSCLSSCPVIKESEEYLGPYFMRYLSKFALDPRDGGERAKEGFDSGLYCCTSCGKCAEVCPKEILIPGNAIEKLRLIACEENIGPLEAHKNLKETILNTNRSVSKLDESFIEYIQKTGKIDKNSKIAFFTGCLVDYRMQKIGKALINILEQEGIKVDVPINQVCCGSPMIRTGYLDVAEKISKTNIETFKNYDLILTVCAGCGATLKNDYKAKFGVNFNVMDISEFLFDKLNLSDSKEVNMRVTYHDPCHLNRGQNISREPRSILNQIKGLDFIEMKKPNQCCGSGGGVKSGHPEIAASLGEKKAEMIKDTDADAVITICPFCQIHIKDSLNDAGLDDIKVMNILELLELAYEK